MSSVPTTRTDRHTRWMLAGVLLLAALMRLWNLDGVPPPLNQDEASRGYDAWAILETGADRHGRPWPVFLESFGPGDFTAALSTYLTLPFVALLGPTVLAMRLPDALLGVLTVALLYAWLKRRGNDSAAWLAAAILATDPWHIALTRTAHESGFTPFLLIAALLALQRAGLTPTGPNTDPPNPAGRRNREAWALLAGLMLAAHAWAYPATRLFTPLLCLAGAVVWRRHLWAISRQPVVRRTLIAAAAGLLIGAMPMFVTALGHPEHLAARSQATLLIHQDLPPAGLASAFVRNYAANLDPRYLFLQADEMSGASIPNVGLHLLITAPLFVAGLVSLLAAWRSTPWARFLSIWLVLYPIPAAICADWNPHPMRTVGGMVLFPVIAAMGGHWLLAWVTQRLAGRRTVVGWFALIALAANLAHFANAYYREFILRSRPGYQAALAEAVQYVAKRAEDADFIWVTNYANQPYIYALLFHPIHPRDLSAMERHVASGPRGFHQVLRIGKYYFAPRDPVGESFGPFAQFDDIWSRVPPDARGLIIDNILPGDRRPGEVLARFPVGDPRVDGQICEIRRCRASDIPRWTAPPSTP